MLNRYYLQELTALRDLGKEFAEAHPAVAPMLSGPTADPDVERLLEGVAFLTAMLREKLDDDFPEIIHDLIDLIWPHYLRPLPAASIVAFTPKPSLKQSLTIKAGTQLATRPIQGTTCFFQTCYDVVMQPLTLLESSYVETPGKAPVIRLEFELKGLALNQWQPESLRLYLSGDYADAADTYYLLRQYLDSIILKEEDSAHSCVLTPDSLQPGGLALEDELIPYPQNSFAGYRILQEYFALPAKFLFLDLVGWEKWYNRGDGSRFIVDFQLKGLPFGAPRIKRDNFTLFATPAVNLFSHDADPIRLDHRRTEYRIRPASSSSEHYTIHSVNKVVGHIQGTAQARDYEPFHHFSRSAASGPMYHISRRQAPARRGADVYMSVSYPPDQGPPVPETLSISLTCTNGPIAENIQIGDICQSTSSTPEFVTFANITTPSLSVLPPLDKGLLWRLLSHLSLNHISLANTQNFKALLGLYLFPDSGDRTSLLANRKRIEGIKEIGSHATDRLVGGLLMRGREIRMEARHDHWASQGDLYLFGCVLNEFFSVYATLNSFTRFVVKENLKGEIITWPARIGDRPLV